MGQVSPTSDFWRPPRTPRTLPTERFIPLLRSALEMAPGRADLRARLAKILYLNDSIEAVDALLAGPFEQGLLTPEEAHLLGLAASAAGNDDLAYRALRAAVDGGHGAAHGYLGELLLRRGDADGAVAVCLDGLARDPLDFKPLGIAARVMLDRGETARLWDLCADLRARGAWSNYLPSAMMLSAISVEQTTLVADWLDEDRLFRATRPAMPPGFHEALAEELLRYPALAPLPRTKATAGAGQRINQLNLVGGPLAQMLLSAVRSEVDRYIADRRGLASPLVAHTPRRATLNSWALIVRRDGHENWHIHPDGWLSGVYYVKTPDLDRSARDDAGDIEFGLNAFGVESPGLPLPNRRVRPEPGLLLLFPSFFAHRTWPTGVEEARICVAFDVIPVAGGDGEAVEPLDRTRTASPPSPLDILVRHPAVVAASEGGAMLLGNVDRLSFLQIDGVGEEIWRRLEGPTTLEALARDLARDYDAPAAVIERQTKAFVETLLAHDLVALESPGTGALTGSESGF